MTFEDFIIAYGDENLELLLNAASEHNIDLDQNPIDNVLNCLDGIEISLYDLDTEEKSYTVFINRFDGTWKVEEE